MEDRVTLAEGGTTGALLTEVLADDLGWIDGALDLWDCSERWSMRGGAPSAELLVGLVHPGVPRQAVVWADAATPVGLVQLVDVDLHDDVGTLALLVDPDHAATNRRGIAAFVADVFDLLPLRKLYVAAHADRMDVGTYLGAAARSAGRYRDHQRRSETAFADLLLHEVWREPAGVPA